MERHRRKKTKRNPQHSAFVKTTARQESWGLTETKTTTPPLAFGEDGGAKYP